MVTIRELRAGDEDQLFALVQQLGHAFTPARDAFDATVAGYLSDDAGGVVVLVATGDDESLLGYALTTIAPLLSTNGPAAQLQEIAVAESARGQDVGTALVRAVEALCEQRGVRQLAVAARRAGGFYDRLGFHENAEYMRRFF